MILVFSIEEDNSTSDVLDWIDHFGENYFRINNLYDINDFLESFPVLMIPKEEKRVTAIWYRKMPSCGYNTIELMHNHEMYPSKLTKENRHEVYPYYGLSFFSIFVP